MCLKHGNLWKPLEWYLILSELNIKFLKQTWVLYNHKISVMNAEPVRHYVLNDNDNNNIS